MQLQVPKTTGAHATGQLQKTVSAALGCQPRATPRGLMWGPRTGGGILSAVLSRTDAGLVHLDTVHAVVRETATLSALRGWELIAALLKDSDLTAVPLAPAQEAGGWRLEVRLTIRDGPLDLPRLNRLSQTLDALERNARALQQELPVAIGQAPEVPRRLKDVLQPLSPRIENDSGLGSVCHEILPRIQAGVVVALVGQPLRVSLELDRLGRAAANLAVLRQPIPIPKLPQLANETRRAGLLLVAPCHLLRPRVTVYELGREVEAALKELASSGNPVLTFGSRDELESIFGVGQGRSHSPLMPVVSTLPEAPVPDLVRAALVRRDAGLPPKEIEELVSAVVDSFSGHGATAEHLLQPLANLAAGHGPNDPALHSALAGLMKDLADCRGTFGTCEEAPARPRSPDLCRHLRRRLCDSELDELLHSRILGQDAALGQLAARLRREATCREETQPMRLLLAGPVGTGKSMAAKIIAKHLSYPYHYIDAASFDSEQSVMTTLAGVSPGIVGSFQDGVLAKVSRRPSVVEVADLDHARPGVRGVLVDFFLRLLQEGTLQAGNGAVIRSVPSLVFVFTSNVAYGAHKANSRLGFGSLSREEVTERVAARARNDFGHAFMSRVGEPTLFGEFMQDTAFEVAEREIRSLIERVTGAKVTGEIKCLAHQIVKSIPTLEAGARGIIDATHAALTDSLQEQADANHESLTLRLAAGRVVLEPDGRTSGESPNRQTDRREASRNAARL